MEANIKRLLKSISGRSTRNLIENHTKELIIDKENNNITILVDSKHILNELLSENDHMGNIFKGVKKAFGEEFKPIIKKACTSCNKSTEEHHDREMNVPHTIHYK